MQIIRVIILTGCSALFANAQAVDFCSLGPKPPSDSLLAVRVRLGFTMHGGYLLSNKCVNKTPAAELLIPGFPDAPKVPFDIDPDALRQLKPFFRLTGGSSEACAVISGSFVERKPFRTKRVQGYLEGNGFGPLGALQFGFVLKSVDEISVCQ
jgi:hypothetical protein